MQTSFTLGDLKTAFYDGASYGREDMELYHPTKSSFDVWFLKIYGEEKVTDDQILEHYGWECNCQSPYELQHSDGSFASGQAASYLMDSLREEYKNEMEDDLNGR